LRQSGYLDVVGEAGSGREGLELIRELQPNVAVLDSGCSTFWS
jgi:DNA-binding NarL/FixJ family response regulator